jgi:lipid II:glycine glycyltransferase (peptidoglycan interpeptide bridge formation enzyme)
MSLDLHDFQDLPDWTLFHQPETLHILLQHFPKWRDRSQMLTLPDGRRVCLALLETDRVGWWRWLEAMPFAFPASPLVEEGHLSHDDLPWISQQMESHAAWFALNIDALSETIKLESHSPEIIALDTHILYLQADFEAVHNNFTKTMRYDMRRAERDGVIARRGYGKDDFRAYYDLMLDSAKRWGLNQAPYPLKLYEALSDFSSNDVSLWLAEFEGKIIGGIINIYYTPTRVLHWSNATLHDYMKYNPAKLLQRDAIQEACLRAATCYNMGPSLGFDGEVLSGVQKSKEALGAKPHRYNIFIQQNAWALRVRSVMQRMKSILPLP